MTPLEGLVRLLGRFATARRLDQPPTRLQRAVIALLIVALRAIQYVVYAVFVALVAYGLQVQLLGASAADTAAAIVVLGAAMGLLIGLRSALDYWLRYDHA